MVYKHGAIMSSIVGQIADIKRSLMQIQVNILVPRDQQKLSIQMKTGFSIVLNLEICTKK